MAQTIQSEISLLQADVNYYMSLLSTLQVVQENVIGTLIAGLGSSPLSVIIFGAPTSSPEGTTIHLTSSVTDKYNNVFNYAWKVTRNGVLYATGNQASFSFTPNDTGSYQVTLTVTDKLGVKGSSSKTISVTDVPPIIAITGMPSQLPLGGTIAANSAVAEASPTEEQAGFNYYWTITLAGGNGVPLATGTQATFSYLPAIAGNYVVSLSVTDVDGQTATVQQPVAIGDSPSNLILLPPNELSSLQQQAVNNTPQWQAFKAMLDKELPIVVGSGFGPDKGAYDGTELEWIANYALGYQILKNIDPTTAAAYADKAIAVIESGLKDYQVGSTTSYQYLARGDGSTTTFALPNSNIIHSSFRVYEAPVQTVAIVRGTTNTDTVAYQQTFLKVSNTPDGNADYTQGVDWTHSGLVGNNLISWLPGGKQPAAGSTYYVTEASSASSQLVSNYTLNGNTITFSTAPSAGQAIYVQYVYNTPTLQYQQTSAGDGGFNSIYINANWPSRTLAYIPIGLDWLDGFSGLSPALQSQADNMLVQWSNWLTTSPNSYNYNMPASNYGAGTYFFDSMTALYLEGRDTAGPLLMSTVLSWRQTYLLPALQATGTGGPNGGFLPEGWSYGWLTAQDLLQSSLALEENGYINATAEHNWASQVVYSLISAQPAQDQVYDAGSWYTYPARFLNPDLFRILSVAAADPTAQSYANYILQDYPSNDFSNMVTWEYYEAMLFNNSSTPASYWSSQPLQYFNSGTGLLTTRSDWGSSPTWLSVQIGNFQSIDHQSLTPGQIQIQRGDDQLLINGNSPGENGAFPWGYMGNIVIVNAGPSAQTYPGEPGVFYGPTVNLPGVTINAYEAANNYTYISGNLTASYNNKPGSLIANPVSSLTREVVYLRPNYVIVYDRVSTLQASYTKEQQWNFLNAPTVSGNSFVESVGSSKLFGQTFSSVPLSLSVQSQVAGSATIQQLEIQNATPTSSVNYLTAFQVAPSTTTTMDATNHILTTDGRMEGTQMGNQLVLFGVAAGSVDLTTPVTYNLSGSNSVSNLLVDLQAGGIYQIKVDGTNIGNVTASSQGTVSFTTAAGAKQVTVTRVG